MSGTIFVDLDGTLVEHCDIPVVDAPLIPLPGAVEALADWRAQGYQIIVTTARGTEHLMWIGRELVRLGLAHDEILTALASGPRVVVNDRKPRALLTPMAIAVEVERNHGLLDVALDPQNLEVISQFPGGSLAKAYLVEDGNGNRFVRKHVLKAEDLSLGYARLREQARALERFDAVCPGIVPDVLREHDDGFEYYFDLEYLDGFTQLNTVTPLERQIYLDDLSATLADCVYRHEVREPSVDWLVAHLNAKVHSQMDVFFGNEALLETAKQGSVIINGIQYPTVMTLLHRLEDPKLLERFAPRRFTMCHGDLTYENILVSGDQLRVIDMDGANFLDAPELDLGKLYQSGVGGYELWAHGIAPVERRHRGFNIVLPTRGMETIAGEAWQHVLACGDEEAHQRGIFYMGLHFLRMARFRLRVSEDQALYAALLAIIFLDQATDWNRP